MNVKDIESVEITTHGNTSVKFEKEIKIIVTHEAGMSLWFWGIGMVIAAWFYFVFQV